MTAKDYLEELWAEEKNIRRLEHKAADMRQSAMPGGIDYSAPRVDHSATGDAMPRQVGGYVDLETEIDARRKSLSCRKAIAATYIAMMRDYDAADVLRRRYLGRRSYYEISQDLKMSERKVYYLHGAGLKELETILIANHAI